MAVVAGAGAYCVSGAVGVLNAQPARSGGVTSFASAHDSCVRWSCRFSRDSINAG